MEPKPVWKVVEEKFTCDHELMRVRHRSASNQYVEQCETCGWCGPAFAHSTLDAVVKQNAPDVDDGISEQWYQARREYAASLQKLNSKEWFEKHAAYLRTPEWRARRTAVLRRDGYMCQACLQNQAKQIHQLTYMHWGHEPLFDLVSVCTDCHDTITAIDRSEKKAEPDVSLDGNGYHELQEIPY